jgi:hypothetical protein
MVGVRDMAGSPSFDSTAAGARVYTPAWRAAAALLIAVSRASLPLLLVLFLLASDPPIGPAMLAQLVALFALVPAVAAVLVRRARAARVELLGPDLVVNRAGLCIEIPHSAIVRIAPWALPLPGPGLALWMRSGNRLHYAIELDDPAPLLDALAAVHGDAAHDAVHHPTAAYAHAAAAQPPWRWYHYLWKFVLFALAPTAVFFNAHQHIAYGGPFGEYHLLGLVAYARTFAIYWGMLVLQLILFAGLWRALAEPVALLGTWLAPAHATRTRHWAEVGCRLLYYGGVPALVAARFLS